MIIRILTPLNPEDHKLLCEIWRPAMRCEVQLCFENYGETKYQHKETEQITISVFQNGTD